MTRVNIQTTNSMTLYDDELGLISKLEASIFNQMQHVWFYLETVFAKSKDIFFFSEML